MKLSDIYHGQQCTFYIDITRMRKKRQYIKINSIPGNTYESYDVFILQNNLGQTAAFLMSTMEQPSLYEGCKGLTDSETVQRLLRK